MFFSAADEGQAQKLEVMKTAAVQLQHEDMVQTITTHSLSKCVKVFIRIL